MHVVCLVVILLSSQYRDSVALSGTVISDDHDYWTIDFSKEFLKRKYDANLQPMVQRVNGNACLYRK